MIRPSRLRFFAVTLGLGVTVAIGSASCEVAPQDGTAVTNSSAAAVEEQQPAVKATSRKEVGTDAVALVDPVPQQPQKPAKQKPQAPTRQEPSAGGFDPQAFPPTIPDTEHHQDSWFQTDCYRCHETGVQGAPRTIHEGMPEILVLAKCRTCHVFIPGSKPRELKPEKSRFDDNAFPPMIPASASHKTAWWKDDCLLCHDGSVRGAPQVVHEGMPKVLLKAKCRTCHVQVRAVEAEGTEIRRH